MRSMRGTMRWWWAVLLIVLVAGGCAGGPEPQRVLPAPAGTKPAALKAISEGNDLFEQEQWAGAKARYEAAIAADPTLAEAHFNLALALDRLGKQTLARKHYLEAANYAPGHKEIWNSRPLRRHGNVVPKSEDFSAPTPGLPGGGLGGGGGGGGGGGHGH